MIELEEQETSLMLLENERLCIMIDDIVQRLGPSAAQATVQRRVRAAEVRLQQERDRHLLCAWRQRVSARARMLGELAQDSMVQEAATILTEWQSTQEQVVPAVMRWLRQHNVPDVPDDDALPQHVAGNGQVYKIGQLAVKVAKPGCVGGADMEREARNMSLCAGCPFVIQLALVDGTRHGPPGVIKVLGMQAAVLTEYIAGLSVRRAAKSEAWVTGGCVQCVQCLLKAVSAMHVRGIVHGDIKPHNIVVDFGLQTLTLIDLGHAALAGEGLYKYGTAGWNAPELRPRPVPEPGDYKCGVWAQKLDIWACGVTMCCFAVGEQELKLPPQRLVTDRGPLDANVHAVAARNRGLGVQQAGIQWWRRCTTINDRVPGKATPIWRCIAECLQHDPAARKNAAALLRVLRDEYLCQ